MNDFAIEVNNVSKIYRLYDEPINRLKEVFHFRSGRTYHRKHYALDNINFGVKKGETLGIIGTNGAGKSTLLKLITGVATPSSGTINVNGKISALLELGAGFNMEYTGLENIYLNGSMLGFRREEMGERVEKIAEFADIGDFLYQPVKTYSSGMFARLAFAVAINIEPDILIVDEALSVGDIFFQNKCYKKFEELRSRGISVLFVSHDITSVKQMCSRVLWIEKGQQRMIGDSVEVCNAYSNYMLEKRAQEFNKEHVAAVPVTLTENNDSGYQILPLEKVEDYPPVQYTNESILSDDVEILSTYITDDEGTMTTDCQVNQNYRVHVIFKARRAMDQCIVGFVLETIKGLWAINTNSVINGKEKPFPVFANSLNHVEFRFTMPAIMNGDYVMGAAISEGTEDLYQTLTWLYHTNYVRINNSARNAAVIDVPTEISIFEASLENNNE